MTDRRFIGWDVGEEWIVWPRGQRRRSSRHGFPRSQSQSTLQQSEAIGSSRVRLLGRPRADEDDCSLAYSLLTHADPSLLLFSRLEKLHRVIQSEP